MKHCCNWCNKVYEASEKFKDKNPAKVYCSQGCVDADNIFKQLCELQYHAYIKKRIPPLRISP